MATEDLEDIAVMRRKLPNLEKSFERDWKQWLKRIWGISLIIPIVSLIVGIIILISTSYYPSVYDNYQLNAPFLNPNLNSTSLYSDVISFSTPVLAPTITIIGLILTITPVMSFFYINDLKEKQRGIQKDKRIHRGRLLRKGELDNKKDKDTFEKYYDYRVKIIDNKIAAVLSYVTFFVVIVIAIFLPFLIFSYVFFKASISLCVDVSFITCVGLGILPILQLVKKKPVFRIKNYVVRPPKIMKKLEAESN